MSAIRSRLFAIIIVIASFSITGCPKDPYRASIQGSDDVANGVSTGIKVTAKYYSQGTFSDSQKAFAARYLTVVTDCNITFRKSVTDVHNSGQVGIAAFLPIADGFVNCVNNSAPLATEPKVQDALKIVDSAIRSISLAISNAKGVK